MAPRKRRQSGVAYLVRDHFWHTIQPDVRSAVFSGFHTVFTIGGRRLMQLKGVDLGMIPNRIDLVDAIVQVYASAHDARKGINAAIETQLQQLPRLPQRYQNQPIDDIDIGISYALKYSMTTPPICVTESAVSLDSVFGWWKINSFGLGKVPLWASTLAGMNTAARRAVGRALGRTIAHEVWHQLWLSVRGGPPYGRPHWGGRKHAWLEAEGGGSDWWKDTSRFSQVGEKAVRDGLAQLDYNQGNEATQFLARRAPKGLLGDFPGKPKSGTGG